MMMSAGAKALMNAVQNGARIDGAANLGVRTPKTFSEAEKRHYTSGIAPRSRVKPRALPGSVPPFLFAAYQREQLTDAKNTASAAKNSRLGLGYRAFERLGLLARTALFIRFPGLGEDATDGEQADNGKEAIGRLITCGLDGRDIPCVRADDIVLAVQRMAAILSAPSDHDQKALFSRHGLQIVGCRIVHRGEPVSDGSEAPLNLSNLKLPFPISFIGCVFEMPLMLNESEMISLDLSGSALPGLEARGLKTAGGVHLRRATIISPVSFTGAEIGGMFDASDALITQMRKVPWAQVEDADHGVLNLSKAIIRNEVLLERTRVWGGLSMRGMEAHRSIFMTAAMIASPMAVLEKWTFDLLSGARNEKDEAGVQKNPLPSELEDEFRRLEEYGGYTEKVAKTLLHAEHLPRTTKEDLEARNPEVTEALADLECVIGSDWSDESLEIMLTESLRARSNAMRADGLKVIGNLSAEHMRAFGRVRLKSAQISGSVRLAGAVLRSGDESRDTLDVIAAQIKQPAGPSPRRVPPQLRRVIRVRNRTALAIDHHHKFVPQDFALDIREAVIEGDISFAAGEQTPRDAFHHALDHTPSQIHGVLGMHGVAVKGSIRATRVLFHWKPKHDEEIFEDNHSRVVGDKLFNRQKVRDEDAKLKPPSTPLVVNGPTIARPSDYRPLIDQYGVILRQATIGKDVDLRLSKGLWGLHLEDARVSGRLRFSQQHHGRDVGAERRITLEQRATDVSGVINLRSTRIEGDCHLVFDPDRGPEIDAVKCVVEGRLNIYPAASARRHVRPPLVEAPQLDPAEEANGFLWTPCKHSWKVWTSEPRETSPPFDKRPVWRKTIARWCARVRAAPGLLWKRFMGPGSSCEESPPTQKAGGWEEMRTDVARWRPRAAAAPGLALKRLMRPSDGALECADCRAVLNIRRHEGQNRREWFIDLRNARTTIFGHAPSAWPHPGALSLDGFQYERMCSLGPLAPILTDGLLPRKNEDKPRPIRWTYQVRLWLALALALVLGGVGLIHLGPIGTPLYRLWAVMFVMWVFPWRVIFSRRGEHLPKPLRFWRADQPTDRRSYPRLLAAMAVAAGFFAYLYGVIDQLPALDWTDDGFRAVFALLISLYVAQRFMTRVLSPSKLQYRPLGLQYLARQRSEPNRFHFLTSAYSPNEPYRTAASALRETGRYLAANEIERQRISNRQKMLSWRLHGMSKLSLILANRLSGYGFRLDRLAGLILVSIAAVAFCAHRAANEGWLTYDPREPQWTARLAMSTPLAPAPSPDASAKPVPLSPLATSAKPRPPSSLDWLDDARLTFQPIPPDLPAARSCHQRSIQASLNQSTPTASPPFARPDPPEESIPCPGWMYAVDLLFPLDLEQPHWKVQVERAKLPSWISKNPLRIGLVEGAARNAMAIIQLYGAMLLAFFIAALALRAEAAFTRVEE